VSGAVDGDALIEFTQALVRIPSVNRPEAGLSEEPAARLVAAQLRAFGFDVKLEDAARGRPNVIAVLDSGRPGPALLFEGHTDVVTEGDPAAWTHPPFAAHIADGRLYGRGAADMKSGVAAMVFAAGALARARFDGRLIVAALADEEGAMLGVKDFVRRGHARGLTGAIICEPEAGEVCTAQKGAIRVGVQARGRMAHGAMPQHGLNPIPALARFLTRCADLEAELQRENGEHPTLGWDYITPTVLRAGSGEQINVIPEMATTMVDVRTTPAAGHERLLARLRERLEPGLELEVIDDRPPTETPADHPVVVAVAEAHRRIYGKRPVLGGVPGSTDGTILWQYAGIPIVTYGPGGKWIAHQVDEYVDVDEVVRAAEVYVEAAQLFLSRGMESSKTRV
jgi:succinyl-diaminopimelate desuccinylase